jgi:uncharacterized membrane protein
MRILRLIRHFIAGLQPIGWVFPPRIRAAIESEITLTESRHQGEICFAIETALPATLIWRNTTPRQRAVALFATLGVWDTAANNGVLVYVLLADHSVELVADRGIAARIPEAEWRVLCAEVETLFRRDEFEAGGLAAIRGVAAQLARHFPGSGGGRNELPNQPILL